MAGARGRPRHHDAGAACGWALLSMPEIREPNWDLPAVGSLPMTNSQGNNVRKIQNNRIEHRIVAAG